MKTAYELSNVISSDLDYGRIVWRGENAMKCEGGEHVLKDIRFIGLKASARDALVQVVTLLRWFVLPDLSNFQLSTLN
jgi:hypothetical protein